MAEPNKGEVRPTDTPTPTPGVPTPEAPYSPVVGRAEFFRSVDRLHAAAEREALGIQQFIGWVLLTFGILAVLLGWAIMSGKGQRR